MLLSDVCLSDVCLTYVAYVMSKSRTETPRKTKIGTEVAHITRDWDTTFKIKRSKDKDAKRRSVRNFGTAACHLANTSNNNDLILIY